MLQWTEAMSVGNEEVDAQHKRLLALVGETEEMVRAGAGHEAMQRALKELCDYVVVHFATEEALMDPETYPEYVRHLGEHMECTTRALDFLESFSEGRGAEPAEFLSFAGDWIMEHVLDTDQTLRRFLERAR
ncbi:MAG: hemerythrin family protein [Desulfovibrionaceae bacterium]|jgi:hemerythrin|nr:hemerythrin family protein [Desulfovibrionaceae bacterium]